MRFRMKRGRKKPSPATPISSGKLFGLEHEHGQAAENCANDARAEVVIHLDSIPVASLDQPLSGARDVGGRQRNRFADGLERLFDALANRGLILRLAALLPA